METFNTFEEARTSVQGTKYMIVNKYKKFLDASLGMEDLIAEADIGIWEAFKSWDPEQSKFNTHAHNWIEWKVKDALNDMNSRFKVNGITNYELSRESESYKDIKAAGKTNDEWFNVENDLDGSEDAKKRFNREMFNHYVAYQSANRRPIYMINESQFGSDEIENFSIFDQIGDVDDHEEFEMRHDLKSLSPIKRQIAEMLLNGADIAEVAKKVKMSKVALLKTFAPKEKLYA